jgi:hypothetical protein
MGRAAPTQEAEGRGGCAGGRERAKGEWRSLREHHLKLAREGYEPETPEEKPAKYVGPYRRLYPWGNKLSDEHVRFLRTHKPKLSYRELAEAFQVTTMTIRNAMQGITFKHLNHTHPPRA